MSPFQKCTSCRLKFDENSDERNYDNYEKYGFKSKKDFEKHSSRNSKCPCKAQDIDTTDELIVEKLQIEETNTSDLPLWPPYSPYKNIINEEDYVEEQEDGDRLLNKHRRRNGKILWFDESKEASVGLINGILNKDINFLTLVAEPGSGKTMVTHRLIYDINKLPWEHSIRMSNITLLTGMSDKDWFEQLVDNLTLATGEYLLNDINRLHNNHCIVHRSNFHKRITYILDNLELLHDHIFMIDEFHHPIIEILTPS